MTTKRIEALDTILNSYKGITVHVNSKDNKVTFKHLDNKLVIRNTPALVLYTAMTVLRESAHGYTDEELLILLADGEDLKALIKPLSEQANTVYAGHLPKSPVQRHSAGEHYPYIIQKVESYTEYGEFKASHWSIVGQDRHFNSCKEAGDYALQLKASKGV